MEIGIIYLPLQLFELVLLQDINTLYCRLGLRSRHNRVGLVNFDWTIASSTL